jgi:hypothetical protein
MHRSIMMSNPKIIGPMVSENRSGKPHVLQKDRKKIIIIIVILIINEVEEVKSISLQILFGRLNY